MPMLSNNVGWKNMLEIIVVVMAVLGLLVMGIAHTMNGLIYHSSHICDHCYVDKSI